MTNHRKRFFNESSLLLLLIWAAAGCVRDDLSHCPTSSFTFTVRAYDADKVTELPSSVEDVVLYIFDRDNLFLQEIKTSIGAAVEVPASAGDIATIVAWGNLGGGHQTRPVLKPGDHISTGAVELLKLSGAGTARQSPDDLFMGTATLAKSSGSSGQIVPIYRKPGKVGITIRGLKRYFDITGENVSIIVNTTCAVIPFSGSHPQEPVSYRPAGAFKSGDEFIVEPLNIFAANGITIDIMEGDRLLARVSTKDGTNPIDVPEGITTNVLVIYRSTGSVYVDISLTPWDKYELWKQYV